MMSHVSPQVLYRSLRRILQRRSNTANLQCGLSWWRTSQHYSKTYFFFGLESTQLACRHCFHQKMYGNKKIKKWSILTFFSGHDRDLTTPLAPLLRASWDRLRTWFWGGHLASWLDKLTWQVVTCQVIWRGAGGEGDKSTWQAQLVKLTCQVPLVLKNKCRTLTKLITKWIFHPLDSNWKLFWWQYSQKRETVARWIEVEIGTPRCDPKFDDEWWWGLCYVKWKHIETNTNQHTWLSNWVIKFFITGQTILLHQILASVSALWWQRFIEFVQRWDHFDNFRIFKRIINQIVQVAFEAHLKSTKIASFEKLHE